MPGREFMVVMAAPHLNDDALHARLSRWPRIKIDECACLAGSRMYVSAYSAGFSQRTLRLRA
jgi:hypothetical protein